MDIFERPYYRFNYRLLTLLGLWPYQNKRTRLFRAYFVGVVEMVFFLTLFLKLFSCNGDPDIMLDAGTIMLVVVNILMKYYTYHSGVLNMSTLLDIMIIDWRMWTSKEEIKILEKYAKKGQFYSLAYAIHLYAITSLFILLPFTSPVMDIIAPMNETRRLELPVTAQYFVDQENHYSLLYFHMFCSIIVGMTTFIAADTQFFVFTCHLCGVLSIVGYRLERLLEDESTTDNSPRRRRDTCFKYVALSINGHKRAMQFAKLIECSFSYPLLIQCGVNVIALSATLYRITEMLSFSAQIVKNIGFLIGQLCHIFCITYIGQQIIDHSSETFLKAYSGPWYDRPVRISKLLLLVMRSSYKPIKLTAGKIFIFSLEGFATIIQTSTSYFMVLLSIR